jgi:hypothetical protein
MVSDIKSGTQKEGGSGSGHFESTDYQLTIEVAMMISCCYVAKAWSWILHPSPADTLLHEACSLPSLLFTLMQASVPMCLVLLYTLCYRLLLHHAAWWSADLAKCMFNQKIGCIEGLKILEVKTGPVVLQIALWCSWSMAWVYSGSSRWIATLAVEAWWLRWLRRCLLPVRMLYSLHAAGATVCHMDTNNVEVFQNRNHFSGFKMKKLWQYVMLMLWNVPRTCSVGVICRWNMSLWSPSFWLWQSGETSWISTNLTSDM